MINKNIISSFLPTFLIASSIGVLIVIGFWFRETSTADILTSQTSEEFRSALENNNSEYFNKFSDDNTQWITEIIRPYPQKMDIEVIQKNHFLFFSFLGLKEKSSVLHSLYGSWNLKTKELTHSDPLIFSIMEKNKKNITFTNNSNIAVPIDNNFILIPDDVEGTIIFSEKLLMPGDSFIFQSEKDIPFTLFQIENLTYGYKATVQ